MSVKFELAVNLKDREGYGLEDPRVIPCARRQSDRIVDRLLAVHESGFGPKQTSQSRSAMSAFGGKADIEI